MLTPEQLKGKIRNVAKEKNLSSQDYGMRIETNMHMRREYDLRIL